jgi:hypothetical protein
MQTSCWKFQVAAAPVSKAQVGHFLFDSGNSTLLGRTLFLQVSAALCV